ncbi:MAG TPA: Hsp20/alpha crystallin family protein [Phycisphaerales bacterium]|nr:Hsp20/alpha crystallin family protein [Phycisphaerales bacterium]
MNTHNTHPTATGTAACGCGTSTKSGNITYRPPMDLYHLSDRYEIHLDLPGATAEQIEAAVDGDVLTVAGRVTARYTGEITPIHAEYGVGDFERSIRLGEDVDVERLDARYQEGVLTIVLPKRAERQPRRVPVKGGSSR